MSTEETPQPHEVSLDALTNAVLANVVKFMPDASPEVLKAALEQGIQSALVQKHGTPRPPHEVLLANWFNNRRPRKKVAIVGFAAHWPKAPFDDDEFEIWSLNEFYDVAPQHIQRVSRDRLRWFEIHERGAVWEGNPFIHSRTGPTHAQRLAGLECPVYMTRHWDDVPMSIAYPLPEMVEKFGRYFTNSISYMIALALHEGFRSIHVYGVDMAQDSEYRDQRPSCEYFIGIARGMLGARLLDELYLPPESDLCLCGALYGFDAGNIERWQIKARERKGELQGRINHNRQVMGQAQTAIAQLEGALENMDYMTTRFIPPTRDVKGVAQR